MGKLSSSSLQDVPWKPEQLFDIGIDVADAFE